MLLVVGILAGPMVFGTRVATIESQIVGELLIAWTLTLPVVLGVAVAFLSRLLYSNNKVVHTYEDTKVMWAETPFRALQWNLVV